MKICVYGAASPTIDPNYMELVEQMGKELGMRGHSLVFGGGGHGLMGAAARGVRAAGGYIIGVIPKFFNEEKVEDICDFCNELIEPDTMRERKQIMENHADAFIVVPGGIGTFEEFFEILTLKQLCRHSKPIAIYNLNGYYNDLLYAMEQAMEKNFIKETCKDLYYTTDNLNDMFHYLETPVEENRSIQEFKEG